MAPSCIHPFQYRSLKQHIRSILARGGSCAHHQQDTNRTERIDATGSCNSCMLQPWEARRHANSRWLGFNPSRHVTVQALAAQCRRSACRAVRRCHGTAGIGWSSSSHHRSSWAAPATAALSACWLRRQGGAGDHSGDPHTGCCRPSRRQGPSTNAEAALAAAV